MKVLLVSQEMPPETGWGGIGTYVNTISQALTGKGAEVHVLSVVPGLPASTRQIGGVTVHRRPLPEVHGAVDRIPEAWRRAWLSTAVTWLTHRLSLRPDVVECPEWMAEGFGLGMASRLPLVVHLHSSARQIFPHNGQGRRARGMDGRAAIWLEETAVRRAHAVISTPWNLDEMAPLLGLEPAALHPLWYPLHLPARLPVADPGRQQVTFLGRFEPRKGPDVLLGAVPAVLAAVPEARFAFVGRDATGVGQLASADWLRREAARLGVTHAVEVREEFGREAVMRALREASVCAFPSRWESFGYSMAEAQGVGRPVVVSSIPALRALVDEGAAGATAASEDPGSWAEPLIALLKDPARAAALGDAGATRLAQISDPSRVADETLAVYEHAIERRRRRERAGTVRHR
ncbi:MAG TPA: glycosyltransferase family 4 protein [Solirubrobacteraceae bacterium]